MGFIIELHLNVGWCMVGMSRKWDISANLLILDKKKQFLFHQVTYLHLNFVLY